jgi:hypothetical protein
MLKPIHQFKKHKFKHNNQFKVQNPYNKTRNNNKQMFKLLSNKPISHKPNNNLLPDKLNNVNLVKLVVRAIHPQDQKAQTLYYFIPIIKKRHHREVNIEDIKEEIDMEIEIMTTEEETTAIMEEEITV